MDLLMTDRHREISNALQAFSFGQIQDCVSLLSVLERHDLSTTDLRKFVSDERQLRVQGRERMNARQMTIERRLPKCPTCGIPMVLREVRPPDPGIGDPGDPSEGTHWTCLKCRFGRYDRRTIQEVRKSIGMDVGTTTPDPEGKPALPAHK